MILAVEIILGLFIFIFGSCIFSFVNVVAYRLPLGKSFVKGFSACPSCGHRLYGKDMIPIFSWIFLGGKCRYCKASVSGRYTLVELTGGLLALLTFWKFDWSLQSVLVFAVLAILMSIALIDADTMEIPDGLNVAIFILGIASIFVMPEASVVSRAIGFLCVSIPMLVIACIVPGGFGGGDIKLMAAIGVFLGWKLTLAATFFGLIFGGFYGMWLLLAKKADRKSQFAFGPFLCIGITIAIFYGNTLIQWWLGLYQF